LSDGPTRGSGRDMGEEKNHRAPLRRVLREYVLGLGVGVLAALYGMVAMVMGRTFLPGYNAQGHMIAGASGTALAAAYLLGGIYLVLRLFVEPRTGSDGPRTRLYILQMPLLLGFIVALIYVLIHVGAVQ